VKRGGFSKGSKPIKQGRFIKIMSWDLGVAYFKEAQYDNAINEWGQLEVSAYLDFNIASAYLAKQDLNNAETYFSEAIIYDTEFALAYFSRGYALGLLKDYDEAIETFNECLSVSTINLDSPKLQNDPLQRYSGALSVTLL
jgi:tetratricopeptide (TPR) repeat protein